MFIRTIAMTILCFFSLAQGNSSVSVEHILNTVTYKQSFPLIITDHEWKELQLDRLITVLDRTKTSFGLWGLKHLLQPIADYDEIMRRQKIVAFLVENPDILDNLRNQLDAIHGVEKELLSYWDEQDKVNAACDSVYYTVPGLKKYLNKNSIALNASYVTNMFTSAQGLLVSLCLGGVYQELNTWLMTNQKDFSLIRGIKKGLKQPIQQHSFSLNVFKDRNESDVFAYKDYMLVFGTQIGSFGDRYALLCKGYTFDLKTVGISFINESIPAIPFHKGLAFLLASIPTLSYDYIWGLSLSAIAYHVISINRSLTQLQNRLADVGHYCNTLVDIRNLVKEYSFISKACGFNQSLDISLKPVLKNLSAQRFGEKRSYIYSRGHVLSMNTEFKQVKNHLVPLMQSIALLDAYCSIAQLYKESQGQSNAFCFVQFEFADKPFINYRNAWLALLPHDEAVANNLFLGQEHSGKIVITGPNGGGKSTILKTYGSVVLAQSCGIVPAQSARQTIFTTLKTAISPHENLQEGLSTFMAEKKCMQELYGSLQKSSKNHHVLALIDEPYKGTVDDESAKRIYSFGTTVAQLLYALLCIATHVKKPIELALDTQGIFDNYHVEIREKAIGKFERMFVLKQGPATWWFEDQNMRGRFIDWISEEIDVVAAKKRPFSIDAGSSLLYS